MKIRGLAQWMFKRIAGNKAEGLHLLRRQRILLHQGRVTTAEVIETSLEADKVGTMLPVRLWVKLKTKEKSFIYTHTTALISGKNIPVRGQTVTIKYLPDNLSSVLILH